jgi:hypothetical protein
LLPIPELFAPIPKPGLVAEFWLAELTGVSPPGVALYGPTTWLCAAISKADNRLIKSNLVFIYILFLMIICAENFCLNIGWLPFAFQIG